MSKISYCRSNGANAWTIVSNGADALHNDGKGYYVYTSAAGRPNIDCLRNLQRLNKIMQ